jgi:hypothetical protein
LDERERLYQQYRFFHWDLEFPEVFIDLEHADWKENPGFDAVVGNPPYVDLKGMDTTLVDYYFSAFEIAENRINIFAFFLYIAVQLIGEGRGLCGLIVPTVLLVQESYRIVREALLLGTSVTNIVRLPSELFGEAAGEVKVDTMILCAKRVHHSDNITDVLIYSGFDRIEGISPNTATAHYQIAQSGWLENKAGVMSLTTGSKEDLILRKITANTIDLETICVFCLGLTPYDKYAGHTKEQIEYRVFHSSKCMGDTWKRLLASGDVDRYVVEWSGEEWINYGDWLAAPREVRFFREKRILVNQIVDWTTRRIKAGLTDKELRSTSLPHQMCLWSMLLLY